MRQHWQYLNYVLRHKWYVFLECLLTGVPLWTAIFHDWDKFLPSEWIPYSRYFYGGDFFPSVNSNTFRTARLVGIWLYTREEVERDFTRAWNAHQKWNKHHWQYWLITWDRGETEAMPMPDVFQREMLADWKGAGKALGKTDTAGWYMANKDKMILRPDTRAWIEEQLNLADTTGLRVDKS